MSFEQYQGLRDRKNFYIFVLPDLQKSTILKKMGLLLNTASQYAGTLIGLVTSGQLGPGIMVIIPIDLSNGLLSGLHFDQAFLWEGGAIAEQGRLAFGFKERTNAQGFLTAVQQMHS